MKLAKGQAVVIEQPWGGLGDNLQFSTLPELFARRGHPVLISSRNAVRNEEIHDLVWGRNPYISGVSNELANAGACLARVYDGGFPRLTNFIRRIEIAHGLTAVNDYPMVYYRPTIRSDFEDAILIDLGSTSTAATVEQLMAYLQFVFRHFFYDPKNAFQISFRRIVAAKNNFRLRELRSHEVRDIFDFCDVIYSCKALITVHSGAHSLGVALRQQRDTPAIHCFSTCAQYNWRNYIFPRVEYFVA